MTPKNIFIAMLCTAMLAWGGLAVADEYRPDEFLSLDLPSAVLSPKPLGPAQQFTPVEVEANANRTSGRVPVRAEPKTAARIVVPKSHVATRAETRVAHSRAEKPRGAARTKLARRHGNPLDAQAFDTRIQDWPCKSGGICNWQRN